MCIKNKIQKSCDTCIHYEDCAANFDIHNKSYASICGHYRNLMDTENTQEDYTCGKLTVHPENLIKHNWLQLKSSNEFVQVLEIYETQFMDSYCRIHDYSEVEPIPLTHDILRDNGFYYHDEDNKFFPETWVCGDIMLQERDGEYIFVATSDYDDEDTNDTPIKIKYMHELQNLFKMCGH